MILGKVNCPFEYCHIQEQYIFVYDALLEAIVAKDTTIPKSSFRATYDEMTQTEKGTETPLDKQYDVSTM